MTPVRPVGQGADALDVDDLIGAAESLVGYRDPESGPRTNLTRLVDALREDQRLTPLGQASARKSIIDRTADRLRGLSWLDAFPEIGDEVIDRPTFLTGLPRSGTTYIQYLFDHDPRFRCIRTWEAITPSPPPGHNPESVTRRKAEETARREAAMAKKIDGFEAMHLVDVDGPDECHAFMEHSGGAAGYHNLYDVPSYFEFMMTELDFTAVYRAHKRQLQLLQWQLPQPRWALKYPNHVLAMDQILDVHPSARFVMTHRDPVQTLASIAKLTSMLRGTRYDDVDPHRVGQQMLHFIARHIDRIMEFCRSPRADVVTHVDYYRVVDNPAAVMAEVHAALGLDTPEPVRTAVARWRRDNPKGARGANPYTLEQYGLNPDAVAEQFGEYMRHFDIPREKDGLGRSAG